jgi:hypothetical protein
MYQELKKARTITTWKKRKIMSRRNRGKHAEVLSREDCGGVN